MGTTAEPQIQGLGDQSQVLEQVGTLSTHLLGEESEKNLCYCCFKANFKKAVCLKSKPAALILLWSFTASALQWNQFDPYSIINTLGGANNLNPVTIIACVHSFFAVLYLFYPVAGLLADVRYGRRKCVIGSLWSYVIGCFSIPLFFALYFSHSYIPLDTQRWSYAIFAIMLVFIGVPVLIGVFVLISSVVAFNANVIQFGLDQLHDSPTEYLVLYIHLYVLLFYVGSVLSQSFVIALKSRCFLKILFITFIPVLGFVMGLFFILLLISLCIVHWKGYSCFLADPGSRNPYKLVCKVICFARKHNYPIQRSAFTYCEDELPSRFDLGKEKYGGPFSVEEVENVKVFLGILKVLLSLGPLLTVERTTYILLPTFSVHLTGYSSHCVESIVSSNIPSSLISIAIFVVYILVLRPLFYDYIPGILKRMGLGMILLIVPTLSFFIIDIIGHTRVSHTSECFLTMTPNIFNYSEVDMPLGISPLFVIIPSVFYSCGFLVFYVAVFEFVCAQSPYSMKGLLVGMFFAIRGVFQLLGALVIMLPFLGWRLSTSFPSCGFVFCLMNLVVALIGLVAFTCVAGKYQYRQRDEPDNIYRYAEEYYAKSQDESNYDYDDYDNLDVQTIT